MPVRQVIILSKKLLNWLVNIGQVAALMNFISCVSFCFLLMVYLSQPSSQGPNL